MSSLLSMFGQDLTQAGAGKSNGGSAINENEGIPAFEWQ